MEKRFYLETARIQQLVAGFDRVLNDGPEEAIQVFLKKYDLLFDTLSSFGSNVIKLPKQKLGSEYVTDFVLLYGGSMMHNSARSGVTFIEIERADQPLFTKAGDPSALVTHALRQVQDWKRWVEPNRDYVARTIQASAEEAVASIPAQELGFPLGTRIHDIPRQVSRGFRDHYMVIAGRRGTMSLSDRLRLERMNEDLNNIEIITFDELLDRFLHRLGWFKHNGNPYFKYW